MNEDFWDAVQERADNPMTPAKRIALESGEPLPIERYDFICWVDSFKVCGWVSGEAEVAGRAVWLLYNPVTQAETYLFKTEAKLLGYARLVGASA